MSWNDNGDLIKNTHKEQVMMRATWKSVSYLKIADGFEFFTSVKT